MVWPHRITVTYRDRYREFELPASADRIRLGTTAACELRLNRDDFFDPVEFLFEKAGGQWQIAGGAEFYLYDGGGARRKFCRLKHGDILTVRYASTGTDAFCLEFAIDFEYRLPVYDGFCKLADRDLLQIGSRQDADLRLTGELCRGALVQLRRQGDRFILEEKRSPYGVCLNGIRVTEKCALEENDFFSVSDAAFYYRHGELYFDRSRVAACRMRIREAENAGAFPYPVFVRNTRRRLCPDRRDIEILDPSPLPSAPENRAVLSLIPAAAMLALIIFLRPVNASAGTFVLFTVCQMGISAFTAAAGIFLSRRRYRKAKKERGDVYRQYIRKKEDEIRKARRDEQELLSRIWYGPAEGLRKVMRFDPDCFDRIPGDDDYLDLFLGTGKVPSLRQVRCKVREQLQEGDELSRIPEELCRRYRFTENAPVVIPLREAGAVGITGPEEDRNRFFRNVLADIVCRQFCTEVIFFVLAGDDTERISWIRNLPQLRSEGDARNIAYDSRSRSAVFEKLYRELAARREKRGGHRHIVVFALGDQGLTAHPLSRFIGEAAGLGTSFVFFEEDTAYLPLHCSYIVELKGGRKGQVYRSADAEDRTDFTYEEISRDAIGKLVLKVAPVCCREISLDGALRGRLTLFELLGIWQASDLDLQKRWQEGDVSRSMAVPMGINARGETVFLDLHEKAHGPHGLIAGTTGSGKSELLQSYIISCAVHFSPRDIGFVIIDFKGGGLANQFCGLPHLMGTLTNMDGKEAGRFMRSLKAELLRRQALFAETGVNRIDRYIQLCRAGKTEVPLPHLVIIVDEFAELRAERPDFMKELISASRIGRSLGVHLILATQKPAGQVSDQIWSNSRFRVCLKVQDAQDSREVIRSPLAAEIREPGRAYLQVGNSEVFELFQSAYSGGAAMREDESARKTFAICEYGLSGRTGVLFEQKPACADPDTGAGTELKALAEAVRSYCVSSGIRVPDGICRPPLAEKYGYPAPEGSAGSFWDIPVGIYDDPDHQYQGVMTSGAGRGNVIVIGRAQTGKTNFLQVIIRYLAEHYSPEQSGIYIFDFGSMFLKNYEELAHVGGVALLRETERVRNLFRYLLRELKARQDRFAEAGVSSFQAYLDAGRTDMRKLCIMMDNFAAFRELYMEKYEQIFFRLCRDGPALGITVILTNTSAAGLGYRWLSFFSERICFFCNDRNDYGTMLERCPSGPEDIPGRAVFRKEGELYEAQIYLAFEGERETDRSDAVRRFAAAANERYRTCEAAERIPEIPETLRREDLAGWYAQSPDRDSFPLGLDYESLEPVTVNFRGDLEFAVTSGKREKVRRFLQAFMQSAVQAEGCAVRLYILDSPDGQLSCMRGDPAAARYTSDIRDLEAVMAEVLELARSGRASACDGGGASAVMTVPVVILNGREMISALSQPGNAFEYFTEIAEMYRPNGILFVYAAVDNVPVSYNGPEILRRIRNVRRLLFLDELSTFRLFDLPSGCSRVIQDEMKKDDGYWIDGTGIKRIKCISCTEREERKDIYE